MSINEINEQAKESLKKYIFKNNQLEAILPECIRSGHPDRNPESDQCRSHGNGCDHARKSRRESIIRSIPCGTDPVYHDTDLLRSDLRSNGSDGAVLGEERHQNDRESPGYGIKCRTHRCGSIRRSSPWHAGDTDADLYL